MVEGQTGEIDRVFFEQSGGPLLTNPRGQLSQGAYRATPKWMAPGRLAKVIEKDFLHQPAEVEGSAPLSI